MTTSSQESRHSIEIPNTPFRFILFAIKPYWKLIILGIVLAFLFQLFGDLIAYVLRGFIDSANAYTPGEPIGELVFWLIAFPALSLLSSLSVRGTGFVLNYLTVNARTQTVRTLFEYLSLHSLSYFSDRFSGSLSSRVNKMSGNISRLLHQFVWSILGTFFSIIISFVLILFANTTLAFAFLVGLIILIPINLALTRPQAKLSKKMAETAAKLSGHVIDAISNISAIQQYARRDHEILRLDKAIEEHREADIKSDNFRERVLLTNNILIVAFIASLIVWSFFVWRSGSITVGELIMIITLARGFTYQLVFVGQNLNQIMESYGEIKDGLDEIIVPHDIIDTPNATKLVVDGGNIEFENVTFSYEDSEVPVLENLSFSIKSGERVGVVGTSGAGKTTLIKLLLRQHDIDSGAIIIDGHNIKEVTQESLRDNISIVPQEPALFHRTVRENIMYGDLDATEDEMIAVAKKAQAHDFITELPDGYDSLVGERGVKLSVGQRQRIAIARAFLKNAPILILDEATSALDSESEVAVQKALHNLMEDKTVLAIAHRLSTLREMDRIIVFKDGEIAEDGDHKELSKKKSGVYASLWEHQAGGFIKEDED